MAKEAIRDQALDAGFDAVGFAAAELGERARRDLARYIEQGFHGDMGWLEARSDRRSAPARLWPEVRSVVVVASNYTPVIDPLDRLEPLRREGRGAISVYAQNRDYHDVMKKRLRSLARWMHEGLDAQVKLFVDTAPVMEKPLAQRAGIGWQGKHTNLVSKRFGSWLFLGEIYTDLALAPDDAAIDHCGTCRQCQDICPTNAFPAPYELDARRCISYLTIEHKGHIAAEFRRPMGNRIYGCDDCLAVCPWNKFATATGDAAYLPRAELVAPRLAELAALDDAGFRKVFAGSPVKRIGRDRFVRNVLIAIGNSEDRKDSTLATTERLLDDPAAIVRAMAVWALAQIAPAGRFEALRARYFGCESDPAVRQEWTAASDGESKFAV